MWWQVAAALGALLLAIPGTVIGVIAFQRTARSDEAKRRAEEIDREVNRRVDAQQIGLGYMERALKSLQDQNLRQQGEIGELRGQLKDCRDEREALRDRLDELEGKL